MWPRDRASSAAVNPASDVAASRCCARDGGNYLLNIGPQPDGGIPPESVRILTAAGEWIRRHGDTIYGADVCQPHTSVYANFTRKGNTLYMHVYFWPAGGDVAISGLKQKVLSAKILKTGAVLQVSQDGFRTHITGLPEHAPDAPLTTLAIECDGVPEQDTLNVRINKPRLKVGI